MKKLSIYAIALLAAGGAQAATLVTNGGFEDGTVNSTPTGWTSGFTGNAADPFVRSGTTSGGLGADEGSNKLQFRGNSASPTGGSFVSQALTTVALTNYDLSFALAADVAFADLSVLVTVTSDGGTLGDLFSKTYTFSDISTYTPYSETFTATNTTSTLRFLETSSNTEGKDPYLDNVSVVPEPSAFTLIGLVGFTLILRRRR